MLYNKHALYKGPAQPQPSRQGRELRSSRELRTSREAENQQDKQQSPQKEDVAGGRGKSKAKDHTLLHY